MSTIITIEQKVKAKQSFMNLLCDVKTINDKKAVWTAKDVEDVIYFINLRLGQRNALEGKTPLSLRCALIANEDKK